MSSARTMSDTQRKEVLDRLILERQSKPSLSSAPSTESLADKRERVQQLLRERRAAQGRSLLLLLGHAVCSQCTRHHCQIHFQSHCQVQVVMPRWQAAGLAAPWCHQRAQSEATQTISTHGRAVLQAHQSCMMIIAQLAEEYTPLVYPVISRALAINYLT